MKKLWPLLLVLAFLHSIHAQEVKHAPTVEQCRADQRLWLDRLQDESSIKPIPYTELSSWFTEMHECEIVDPDHKLQYYNTTSETTAMQWVRLTNFLLRHNLYDQFIAEDAQGRR
jgi:hypothetical protein